MCVLALQIRHRFRDDAMADDLDMSGLRLAGMPDVQSPTVSSMDLSGVRRTLCTLIRMTVECRLYSRLHKRCVMGGVLSHPASRCLSLMVEILLLSSLLILYRPH